MEAALQGCRVELRVEYLSVKTRVGIERESVVDLLRGQEQASYRAGWARRHCCRGYGLDGDLLEYFDW